jgi:hypothetical protein
VNTSRWEINAEHRVEWVSGGTGGERVNLTLYLNATRLRTINVNSEGDIQSLDSDDEHFLWFVSDDFNPSDKYSIRIEFNGHSYYQDSELFALVVKEAQSQSQSSLFGGTMIFTFIFSCVVFCSVFALPLCCGVTISDSFGVWGLCVVTEVVNLVILLIGWLMFADTATASCDAIILTAVLIQANQVVVVFAMVIRLDTLSTPVITFIQYFCLALDLVQIVLFSISAGTCGDGIIIPIVIGVGLLLVFATEYSHLGKLDSTNPSKSYSGANRFHNVTTV